MNPAEPQKEHAWLEQLVGNWTSECEFSMAPGEPPMTIKGKESVRSLGGLWTIGDGEGDMPTGGVGHTVMTLGYDPQKATYIGTFVGSMMTHLWNYTSGSVDAAGRVLTLDAEGPGMDGSGTAKYKDAIEFVSKDHRTLTSRILGEDGEWTQIMTVHYRRAG